MNGLPYYKAYPRDFIEGTIGMPFEIKCAYRVVLDLIYMQGGNLPDDARYISGMLGCTLKKWDAIRSALLSADKIQVSGKFLTNYRAVIELETLRKLQEKQAKNASTSNKIKDLPEPRLNHTEPEPDTVKDTSIEVSKKRASTGSRLKPDWEPSRAEIEFAISEGMTAANVRREADKFRDFWTSKSGANATKLDWSATWKNWVRRAADDRKPREFAKPKTVFDVLQEKVQHSDIRRPDHHEGQLPQNVASLIRLPSFPEGREPGNDGGAVFDSSGWPAARGS